MNLTLKQMRAFLAVVRTGSFTLAAQSLFITQSALSGLIRDMEAALGLQLFERSTRRVGLSPLGRELYPQIEKILQDLDAVVSEVGQIKALAAGIVRVAVPQLLACTLIPAVMRDFAALHPRIGLRLVDCAVDAVTPRVFAGEVDFGVGPERAPNSDIQARQLFEQPFMAVVPPTHALATAPTLSWSELTQWPLITLQGQFTDLLMSDMGEAAPQLQRSVLAQVSFMSTALAMVAHGQGITLCLPYAWPLVRQFGLVMRPIAAPSVQRSFWLFRRKGHVATPAAQAFEDFLADHIQRSHAHTLRQVGLTAPAPEPKQ